MSVPLRPAGSAPSRPAPQPGQSSGNFGNGAMIITPNRAPAKVAVVTTTAPSQLALQPQAATITALQQNSFAATSSAPSASFYVPRSQPMTISPGFGNRPATVTRIVPTQQAPAQTPFTGPGVTRVNLFMPLQPTTVMRKAGQG